jgi:hypothetical protein
VGLAIADVRRRGKYESLGLSLCCWLSKLFYGKLRGLRVAVVEGDFHGHGVFLSLCYLYADLFALLTYNLIDVVVGLGKKLRSLQDDFVYSLHALSVIFPLSCSNDRTMQWSASVVLQ